jgi:hypothetical protein
MRGPVAKIPEESFLSLGFGTKFKDLLLPEKIEGKSRGDGKGELVGKRGAQILGETGKENGVTRFVVFDEMFAQSGFRERVAIFQVVDIAAEERVVGLNVAYLEKIAADGDDVHAAVFIGLKDF